MIKSLTIVYVTARTSPMVEWFLDSLALQCTSDNVKIIIVSTFKDAVGDLFNSDKVKVVNPKPTIWQGEYKITRESWWAKSNAMNTGIALCDTEWIAFVDDRSVLMPGWLQCVQDSMIHTYAVCGSYEKRANMRVTNGEITNHGDLLGIDIRTQRGFPHLTSDWYGGSGALPLEWCLMVNGFPEDVCDGLGFEDIQFGKLLNNNHLEMRYDSRMRIVEDRTQSEIGGALKRGGKKGKNSPWDDKDYAILNRMGDAKTSQNSYDIRELRQRVLSGKPFPSPTASHFDWYDNAPIAETGGVI